jgi:hypothetical protein
MKSESLNLLETSGPNRACYGTPLPLHSAMVYVIQMEEFHPGPVRQLSTDLYGITIAECTVNKLLMMDRGTVREM